MESQHHTRVQSPFATLTIMFEYHKVHKSASFIKLPAQFPTSCFLTNQVAAVAELFSAAEHRQGLI